MRRPVIDAGPRGTNQIQVKINPCVYFGTVNYRRAKCQSWNEFGKFEGSTFEIEAMEGRNMANGSNFRIWKQEEIESLELS